MTDIILLLSNPKLINPNMLYPINSSLVPEFYLNLNSILYNTKENSC